ncbi:MAG: hypothetical protein D6732_19080 [Methanobacteriota archaeon]|nr:MAG: hypothetical protein D6732_19080 [Euryarchaeota archaeon]
MPHRIKWLTEAHYQDPLVNYGSTEFILQFQDAAEILRKWRNPHLGRSSREGTIIRLANEANKSVELIRDMLLTTNLDAKTEEQLIDQLKVLNFMMNYTLPEALELVNKDLLLTPEDIMKFIERHLELMRQEYGRSISVAQSMLSRLNELTDIEIRDQFGRKRRVQQSDVLDVLGKTLGNMIIRQASLRPVDNIDARPRGKIKKRHTYKAAILRSANIPPPSIETEDIRVVDKDRLSLIYFIVDVSQSMARTVFSGGLTRLDGALLTSLGLYYYFNLTNRRKRREFDTFKMHLVPVTEVPYVIDDNARLERFLFEAEAKGKTRLVHAVNAVVNHVTNNHKENDYDVQIIVLTDGRPNVPFKGKIPGRPDKFLIEYFEHNSSSTKTETKECMIQLNQYFNFLKKSMDRNWDISYFLMAPEKFKNSDLYRDTKVMLGGITKPILIDPTKIDQLGARIIQEAIAE